MPLLLAALFLGTAFLWAQNKPATVKKNTFPRDTIRQINSNQKKPVHIQKKPQPATKPASKK